MSNVTVSRGDRRSRRYLRIGAFGIGLIGIVAGPVLHLFVGNPHVGWATMIAGLIFMVSSRFDEVVEIGFGSFKTKLERRVRDIEETMEAVRRLAKASARNALNSVQYAARWGGFRESEKLKFLHDTRKLLTDLGVTSKEIEKIEVDWHRAVEFDYVLLVLGRRQVPTDLPGEMRAQWEELRSGGIERRATPHEIRSFFQQANMLTPEREEMLKDYEHYIAKRQHRRLDVWLSIDDGR